MKITDVLNRLARAKQPNILVIIGKQEALALRDELHTSYNQHIDLNTITAGNMEYRGLRIVVGHQASCTIVCQYIENIGDNKVFNAC